APPVPIRPPPLPPNPPLPPSPPIPPLPPNPPVPPDPPIPPLPAVLELDAPIPPVPFPTLLDDASLPPSPPPPPAPLLSLVLSAHVALIPIRTQVMTAIRCSHFISVLLGVGVDAPERRLSDLRLAVALALRGRRLFFVEILPARRDLRERPLDEQIERPID